MSIQDDLIHEAHLLGFQITGFTRPRPPEHIAVYRRWLEQGRHSSMAYLSTPETVLRRANPEQVLPEATTWMVVGLPYHNPQEAAHLLSKQQPTGRVAAYAWGKDYHNIIPARLKQLADLLENAAGAPVLHKAYTDTGPILERDFAQRAGLGWIGKNTCLINPQRGSYFFLGELLLNYPLPQTPAFTADHCGSCRRCIEACPTQAILEDRTLDAHRCISFQTIENKAAIDLQLRSAISDWVFGCDICQMVCPWNVRFANQPADPALEPRPGVAQPVLLAEIHLTRQEFNRKFNGSPVQRAKRRGYLRNVAVALGNSQDLAAVPHLIEVLKAEEGPLVRSHAAWALGQLNTPAARTALSAALANEADPHVLTEIKMALDPGG